MPTRSATEDRRGTLAGTLLSGSIGGILLARAFGGMAEWLGWRSPYFVAAACVLTLATVLSFALPRTGPVTRPAYPRLLAEPIWLRAEPDPGRREVSFEKPGLGSCGVLWPVEGAVGAAVV
jgi:MFS family permease